MARYYGKIGYAMPVEVSRGVHEETIIEKEYSGEIIRNTRKLQNGSSINDGVYISNDISILSDPFSDKNFHAIRWAEYMGTKWKVNSVEVKYPRLVLTLGEAYNE